MCPLKQRALGFLAVLVTLRLFISKGIPYLAKKGFEAGRYYASEAMRDPSLQKKAINYGMKKARPAIDKVGRELLDQLSTKNQAQGPLQNKPP